MSQFDIIVVGAGIAGASLAYELSAAYRVAVLEMEDAPGYHATGRSAAFWTESYGGPAIAPLTIASGPFLRSPPAEFSTSGFLYQRGALNIGRESQRALAEKFIVDYAASGIRMEVLDRDEIVRRIPGISSDITHGIFEPDCCDIDVGLLHQAYLSGARRRGAEILCRALLRELHRSSIGWRAIAGEHLLDAPIIVNAAGAWADPVAALAGLPPIGITPYRRTIVQLRTATPAPAHLPLVVALDGSLYFKPENGRYWISPHDEIPDSARDVAPEEWDIALTMDRFTQIMATEGGVVEHKWAGLRSFAPDRLPVIGFDSQADGFFWFAGQGGFGIQTAPAAAKLAASCFERILPDAMIAPLDPQTFGPGRFAGTCRVFPR